MSEKKRGFLGRLFGGKDKPDAELDAVAEATATPEKVQERIDEDAADGRPERRPEDEAHAVDAHGLAALLWFEQRKHQRHGQRLQQPGACTLDGAYEYQAVVIRHELADG